MEIFLPLDVPVFERMTQVAITSIFHSQAPPDLAIIADSLARGSVLLLLALLF
jgi:hypothetical protein